MKFEEIKRIASQTSQLGYNNEVMKFWQLQEAKSKLSELIRCVFKLGPQGISIRGSEEVVVITKNEYDNLIGIQPNFGDFLDKSPLKGLDLKITRNKTKIREIGL